MKSFCDVDASMAVGLGAWGFVVVWVTVVEVAFGGDGASVVVGSRWWRDSGGGGSGWEI